MAKLRILAVDDNTVNLAAIEQELKEKYEVIPMLSGKRALKFLFIEHVDLILLDVEMPIMDGIRTLKEIRKIESCVTVPVIFLTALKDKTTVIEGSRLGIMDYITKPFDGKDLQNRIEHVFKRLGVIQMTDKELFEAIVMIQKCLENQRPSEALGKMNEVMNYKIPEEISGRVRAAKEKLTQGSLSESKALIGRVYEMLEIKVHPKVEDNGIEMSLREIFAKILIIKEYIQNFKTKEAASECKELLQYHIDDNVRASLNKVVEMVEKYDDIAAMAILDTMVADIEKRMIQ